MNKNNIRFTSAVLSLAVAAGITLASPSSAYTEGKVKQGKFISSTMDDEENHYNKYVVKQGDTLSRISEKVCRYFKEERSTEYWPVLAFLNNYPRVIQPSDIIIFPETFEEMVLMNENLKATGWTARYIQKNKVYKNNSSNKTTIYSLLREIYGDSACIDPDFVDKYLRTVGLSNKYSSSTEIVNNNQLFELTDWIPTLDQLDEQKTKKNK